jgi:hypothetical protein
LWVLAGVVVVGGVLAGVGVQVSATPSLPFKDGGMFAVAYRRSSGTWGAESGIVVQAKLRQQIGGMMVETAWVPVSVTRFDGNKTLGVVLTAKRGMGSVPPLYGSLLTTIVDNGVTVPCGSLNVTELPDFDPCPPAKR